MSRDESARFDAGQQQLSSALAQQVGDVVGALRAAQQLGERWLATEQELDRLERTEGPNVAALKNSVIDERQKLLRRLDGMKDAIDG